MTPQEMIERYVHAVGRRLPKPMRADVAAELRELIADGLAERAKGREPDEKLCVDYLISLGSPATLALRYSAPAPVIDPIDARVFGKLAVGIVLTLAVFTVSIILSAPHATDAEWRAIADALTDEWARASLTMLGFLLLVFWLLGAARRKHLPAGKWRPQSLMPAIDPDRMNRPGSFAALLAWTVGLLIIMQPVAAFDILFGGRAPEPLRQVFTFDEGFATQRAAVLWTVVAAGMFVYGWAAIEGRWRKLTRQASLITSAAFCVVAAWAIFAGDVFVGEAANQTMKFGVAIIIGFSVIEVWRQFREEKGERMPPAVGALS